MTTTTTDMRPASRLAATAPRRLDSVLIAEDEHLLARNIASDLGEMGFRVVGPASTGVEALDLARKHRPDLALMDVRMPEMDGLAAARVLHDELDIPVVIMSAYSEEQYVAAGVDSGVFGYLLKPVTVDEMRVSLAVAWGRFLRHVQVNQTVADMERRLEERKLIERAKGMLIKQLGIDEEAAMRTLQRQARDARRPMVELARAIIDAAAVMKDATPGKG